MEIPRHWRLKKQRYGLVGDIDPHTGSVGFPPGTKHRFDLETKLRYVDPEPTGMTHTIIQVKSMKSEENYAIS